MSWHETNKWLLLFLALASVCCVLWLKATRVIPLFPTVALQRSWKIACIEQQRCKINWRNYKRRLKNCGNLCWKVNISPKFIIFILSTQESYTTCFWPRFSNMRSRASKIFKNDLKFRCNPKSSKTTLIVKQYYKKELKISSKTQKSKLHLVNDVLALSEEVNFINGNKTWNIVSTWYMVSK